MTKSLLTLLAASTLVFTACGSDSASDNTIELDGREFLSTSVEGHDLVEGTEVRIIFADEALTADTGCNMLGGNYTLDGDVLDVGSMFGTEMGCEPALMEQDAWLGEFLTSAPTVSLEGDVLILNGNDGTTIDMLDRESADPARPIEGTLWVVDGIVTGDVVSSMPSGVTASMTITNDTAAVETGCNAGSASVAVTDSTLTFDPMAVTLMLCPPDEMTVQDAVLAVLDGEVTYEIDADRLSLRRITSDGVIGLELKADV